MSGQESNTELNWEEIEKEYERETTIQQDGYVRFNSEYEHNYIEGYHHPDDDPAQYEEEENECNEDEE